MFFTLLIPSSLSPTLFLFYTSRFPPSSKFPPRSALFPPKNLKTLEDFSLYLTALCWLRFKFRVLRAWIPKISSQIPLKVGHSSIKLYAFEVLCIPKLSFSLYFMFRTSFVRVSTFGPDLGICRTDLEFRNFMFVTSGTPLPAYICLSWCFPPVWDLFLVWYVCWEVLLMYVSYNHSS